MGSSDDGEQGGGRRQVERVRTGDGRLVEPFAMEGYFDAGGNYIPGWYDREGVYHLGYGYTGEQGGWHVVYGYYDPDGQWVQTGEPVRSVAEFKRRQERRGLDEAAPASARARDDGAGDTLQVTQIWGDQILEVVTCEVPRTISIGADSGQDFAASIDAFDEAFPLVRWENEAYWLQVHPSMRGTVSVNGDLWAVRDAIREGVLSAGSSATRRDGTDVYEVKLGPRDAARLTIGSIGFAVNFVQMPARVGGGFGRLDTDSLPYLGMSTAAHMAFLLLALSLPGQAGALSLDRQSAVDRFVNMKLSPQDPEETEQWSAEEESGAQEEASTDAVGEEGEVGRQQDKREKQLGRRAVKGPPANDETQVAGARARDVAMNAGAMRVFRQQGVAGQFGSASESVGSDAITALGDLDSARSGGESGFHGLGVEGAGRGGGDIQEKGQRIGGLDTGSGGPGHPGHPCQPYPDCADSQLGSKTKVKPETQVVPGPLRSGGGLSRDIIQRVVRSHRRELKYCYEQQLQMNPELAGRVSVDFTIAATGDVLAARVTDSSLDNPVVEQCVTRRIRRWTFPAPKQGQLVEVSYPFNFNSGR